MPDNAAQAMLENTQRLMTAANLLDIPILVAEQYPKGLGTWKQKSYPNIGRLFISRCLM
jgi:hypothetical protein